MIRWQTPTEYECSHCHKTVGGCIGFGHFSERTNAMPPGWVLGLKAPPRDSGDCFDREVYACSQECADKLDQENHS